MNLIIQTYQFVVENNDRFLQAVEVHVTLSIVALFIGAFMSVPLGIVCAKYEKVAASVMNMINSIRVIPSLAILVIILPILGTGFSPALVALTVLSCPPILINTYLGFQGIDPAIIESASGMGMSKRQIMTEVEFPLAMPLIIAGFRTASVEVISSTTLAAFIGGGGLGTFIIDGLGMYNFPMILSGALPIALLALSSEVMFAGVEKLTLGYLRN